MSNHFGSKATSGLCQPIIALMPPHDTYIETHLRDPAALTRFECHYPVEKVHGCAHQFLREFDFQGRELIYCDPPYLHHTRSSKRRYRFEYEEQDHVQLLELLKSLPCAVILSGYPSVLYEDLLGQWRTLELQVMNQAGVRAEKLWFNFTPDRVHWPAYAGRNFTHRQSIKRKAHGWGRRYQAMPAAERLAVLSAIMAVEAGEVFEPSDR